LQNDDLGNIPFVSHGPTAGAAMNQPPFPRRTELAAWADRNDEKLADHRREAEGSIARNSDGVSGIVRRIRSRLARLRTSRGAGR
jgi:hypothetical protein